MSGKHVTPVCAVGTCCSAVGVKHQRQSQQGGGQLRMRKMIMVQAAPASPSKLRALLCPAVCEPQAHPQKRSRNQNWGVTHPKGKKQISGEGRAPRHSLSCLPLRLGQAVS